MKFLLLSFLAAAPLRADLYQWTDEKGVVHMDSRSPKEGSGKVRTIKSEPSAAFERMPVPAAGDLSSLKGAAPSPTVELYTTSWCPYCVQARDYLRARGVPFQEFDVEADPSAADRKRRLGGGGGVPFAVINGKGVTGFSPSSYDKFLSKNK